MHLSTPNQNTRKRYPPTSSEITSVLEGIFFNRFQGWVITAHVHLEICCLMQPEILNYKAGGLYFGFIMEGRRVVVRFFSGIQKLITILLQGRNWFYTHSLASHVTMYCMILHSAPLLLFICLMSLAFLHHSQTQSQYTHKQRSRLSCVAELCFVLWLLCKNISS